MKLTTHRLRLMIPLAAALLALAALAALSALGYIRLREPNRHYTVRGVDVSSYQGEIDWRVLSEQGIKFAYIKATEGSSFTDESFVRNWRDARAIEGLAVGAYHFMSFESPGTAQADNFLSAASVGTGVLPPAVDLELYGEYLIDPPSKEEVRAILDPLLDKLEQAAGKKPVIYVNRRLYGAYLAHDYDEYPIWICDIYGWPDEKRLPWTFWQYSHVGKLPGYESDAEEHIDLNVFYADDSALIDMLR